MRLFRYLEPTFFAGLIDDPCLIVRDRPIHQSIMLDCGALHHLAKRELKPVRAIFVSHAHMDHFMGFDTFLRQTHASPRTVELYGPPGITDRVAAKLDAYDWNLTESYWCTIRVVEVHPDQLLDTVFPGPEGFPRRSLGTRPRTESTIYRYNHLEVAAEQLDHGIPVLAFRVTERKVFAIDEEKLAAQGYAKGAWLRELKKRFFAEWAEPEPLTVIRQRNDILAEETVADPQALYRELSGERQPVSIGYLTDVGYTGENRQRIMEFLSGVKQLFGECAFLAEDLHKARASRHLATCDVNELLALLNPSVYVPIHFSKTYLGRSPELYAELVPPEGTTISVLPEHVTPRPFFACEMPSING